MSKKPKEIGHLIIKIVKDIRKNGHSTKDSTGMTPLQKFENPTDFIYLDSVALSEFIYLKDNKRQKGTKRSLFIKVFRYIRNWESAPYYDFLSEH